MRGYLAETGKTDMDIYTHASTYTNEILLSRKGGYRQAWLICIPSTPQSTYMQRTYDGLIRVI